MDGECNVEITAPLHTFLR